MEPGPFRLIATQDCLVAAEIVVKHLKPGQSLVVLSSRKGNELAEIWRGSPLWSVLCAHHQPCWEGQPRASTCIFLATFDELLPALPTNSVLVSVGQPPVDPLKSFACRKPGSMAAIENQRLWLLARHLSRPWAKLVLAGTTSTIADAFRQRVPRASRKRRVSAIARGAVHKRSKLTSNILQTTGETTNGAHAS